MSNTWIFVAFFVLDFVVNMLFIILVDAVIHVRVGRIGLAVFIQHFGIVVHRIRAS